MKKADEERIAARLAKLMAMICVRNTGIENLHAGTVPVTHTGDFSDVFVTDADGRRIELRPCSRTLGYFTPVRERGTKWDNSDGSTQTIIRRRQLSDCTSLGRRKAALPRSSGLLVHS